VKVKHFAAFTILNTSSYKTYFKSVFCTFLFYYMR